MKFIVPGEPTGKGRPRVVTVGNRRMAFTPEKTALYENLIKLEYQKQCATAEPLGQQIRMDIKAYYALSKSDSKRKRADKLSGIIRPTKQPDIDNVYKVVADALNGLAYDDDSQIVSASIEKHYSERPRVEVEITEVHHEGLFDFVP